MIFCRVTPIRPIPVPSVEYHRPTMEKAVIGTTFGTRRQPYDGDNGNAISLGYGRNRSTTTPCKWRKNRPAVLETAIIRPCPIAPKNSDGTSKVSGFSSVSFYVHSARGECMKSI